MLEHISYIPAQVGDPPNSTGYLKVSPPGQRDDVHLLISEKTTLKVCYYSHLILCFANVQTYMCVPYFLLNFAISFPLKGVSKLAGTCIICYSFGSS